MKNALMHNSRNAETRFIPFFPLRLEVPRPKRRPQDAARRPVTPMSKRYICNGVGVSYGQVVSAMQPPDISADKSIFAYQSLGCRSARIRHLEDALALADEIE